MAMRLIEGDGFPEERSMSDQLVSGVEEEPPATCAQHAVAKASQYLLFFLCAAPIALFPIGLAYKILIYFFP
jgi:hypothetical protein